MNERWLRSAEQAEIEALRAERDELLRRKAIVNEGDRQCVCGALKGKPHTLGCQVAYPWTWRKEA